MSLTPHISSKGSLNLHTLVTDVDRDEHQDRLSSTSAGDNRGGRLHSCLS